MTDSLIARYTDCLSELRAALDGLAESDLDLAPAEGGWTIRQIVHHIADGDDLWKWCIKAALGNAQGIFTLQWYWDVPQDVWADKWQYARRPIAPALVMLETNRASVAEILRATPDALARSVIVRWRERGGVAPERAAIVSDILESQTRHVIEHSADIRKIRQAHQL
jgi:uncharacterized damage-inducible protein DinB